MIKSQKSLVLFLLALLVPVIVSGCSAAQPAANPDLAWAVSLSKFEIKEYLEAVVTVDQYNGSYDEVRQQYPDEGNVYLIVNLTIAKQAAGAAAFDWSQLTIQDQAGTAYKRHENDSFLDMYRYEPRMTGLEIKFGENEGWLCYEIPAEAADGSLSLVYSAEGSQQEINIK